MAKSVYVLIEETGEYEYQDWKILLVTTDLEFAKSTANQSSNMTLNWESCGNSQPILWAKGGKTSIDTPRNYQIETHDLVDKKEQ